VGAGFGTKRVDDPRAQRRNPERYTSSGAHAGVWRANGDERVVCGTGAAQCGSEVIRLPIDSA
jgi:hypothetical protein